MSATVLTLKARARRRRGLTLIEAAMVLVILALVVGGVMLFYQNANQSRQVSEAQSQLAAIQQSVRSWSSGQYGYDGLTVTSLKQYLPAKMMDTTGATLRHAFGGTGDITGDSTTGTFTVQLNSIPRDACQKLSTTDMGRALVKIDVNGTAVEGQAMTRTSAQTACSSASANIMKWTFS